MSGSRSGGSGAGAVPSGPRGDFSDAGDKDPGHHILCLGDSYTVGEGVGPGESWPDLLVEHLRGEGLAVRTPRVVARSGWTGGELEAALEAAEVRGEPARAFALVTLLIGVNDQYRGGRAADFPPVLGRLMERAVTLAGGDPTRVLVISLPDWGVTPFAHDRDRAAIGREIDAFNAVLREQAARVRAGWVDITALTRRLGADPGFITDDGLHLTGAAYARWVDILLPAVREVLRGRPTAGI